MVVKLSHNQLLELCFKDSEVWLNELRIRANRTAIILSRKKDIAADPGTLLISSI